MKKILLLISLILFLISPLTVKAENEQNEFKTFYNVDYDIDTAGIAEITQLITLQNLTDRYYVSNFSLTISSTTITDIIAFDKTGPVETNVENKDNKTTINIKFNEQVVGLDKKQTLTIKFKSKDFAQNVGKTWEVNLPRIPAVNVESYDLILSVPITFGEPASISPKPFKETQMGDKLSFIFKKEDLQKNGVSINFGINQVFDFNLKYKLQNPSLFAVLASITLPPDTNFQDISLKKIDPAPLNVTLDKDGNYLAWFRVARQSEQEIIATGSVKLYIRPKTKKIMLLSDDVKNTYLSADKYWEKDNPAINATLEEIFKDASPKTNKEKIELIYKYVINTLTYDEKRLQDKNNLVRFGALTALNNPDSAVCMEFTDLFITLARAASIPSRELDGFAYTQNSKIRPSSLSNQLLHSWPEYYDDSRGWVMVDPTWENTTGGSDYFNKFDLNHLVLGIKGSSSQTPVITDDVKVTISPNIFTGNPDMNVQVDTPEEALAGLPIKVLVTIQNHGATVYFASKASFISPNLKILGESEIDLGPVPPFGHTSYEIKVETPLVWKNFQGSIEVNAAGQKVSRIITIRPFFLFQPFPYVLGITGLMLTSYLVILGIHIYQKKYPPKPQ